MTNQEAIDVMFNEWKCIDRNDGIHCDRKCESCDLVMDVGVIREAFNKAISALQAQADGDCISRQAAIDVCDNAIDLWHGQLGEGIVIAVKKKIEELPSAQPETSKRIVGKSRNGMTLWYQCDMCNEPVDAQDNFCRGCGRRLTDG